MMVADLGILIYMVFVTLWYFELTIRLAALLPLYVGWICMVTGQSVVLYSRLGLVLGPNRRNVLCAAKWMIIVDATVFHTSTIGTLDSSRTRVALLTKSLVIALCSFYLPDHAPASGAYTYIERLHITAFGLQELILSALYIWTAVDILRTSLRPKVQRIVVELITINFVLVAIDIAGITLEYCNLFFFEVAFKMASYSIKLKLEFAVLSKLMALSGGDEATRESMSRGDSLVFPTEFVTSTGIDKDRYDSPRTHPMHHELSEHDATRNSGGIEARRYHRSILRRSEDEKSASSEQVESFDDFVRRMSRGGSI